MTLTSLKSRLRDIYIIIIIIIVMIIKIIIIRTNSGACHRGHKNFPSLFPSRWSANIDIV